MMFRFRGILRYLLVLSCLRETYGAKKGEVKIVFGGDIECTRMIKYLHDNRNCSYVSTLARLKRHTNDTDFFIANLETTLRNEDTSKLPPIPYKMVTMDSYASVIPALKYAGINWVNIANNHIGDYGEEGVKRTTEILQNNHIKYFGVNYGDPYSHQKPLILEKNGLKIGLLGYSDCDECKRVRAKAGSGTALINASKVIGEVKTLRKKGCDIVILFMHWGMEYTQLLDLSLIFLIKRLLRGGAKIDLIVGAHPHVTHKHWYVNDTLIATSLGNLLFQPYAQANVNFNDKFRNRSKDSYYEDLSYKQGLVMEDATSFGRLLKVTFDRNGIVKRNTSYLNTRISQTKEHCIFTDRKDAKTEWRTICEQEDPECIGTAKCNYIQCDDKDPIPDFYSGAK